LFKNRTVVVVGAAQGIGKATVEELLKKKYTVIGADVDEEKLEILRQSNSSSSFSTQKFDITHNDSVLNLRNKVKAEYGSIWGLVITAGIHSTCPIEYLKDETIKQVFDINLIDHIRLVRDFLPLIEKGGRVIGVSSIAAIIAVPMSSLYSASKFGLEGFYEALSIELAYREINSIIIEPGNVNTGFNEKGNHYSPSGNLAMDEGYKNVVAGIDSKKGIRPQEVAKVILKALSSPRPKFCYLAGPNAKKAYWAKKILGRTLAKKLMARHFGL
jgi:NAD(P)-dependent dehydrogenase (short-subunit alcohol dehydrogenase family)